MSVDSFGRAVPQEYIRSLNEVNVRGYLRGSEALHPRPKGRAIDDPRSNLHIHLWLSSMHVRNVATLPRLHRVARGARFMCLLFA